MSFENSLLLPHEDTSAPPSRREDYWPYSMVRPYLGLTG